MTTTTLRAVPRRPLTLAERVRRFLSRPRRYWRCDGCRRVTIRRWRRDPPRMHLPGWTAWRECGRWMAISATSASAMRARLR